MASEKRKSPVIKKKFTLSKEERLKSRKRIEQLFREGKSFTLFPLKIYYLSDNGDDCLLQAGFGVSTKNFKKAVDRNRIKRLMKEAYRLQKGELESIVNSKDIRLALFFIYTAKELPEYRVITDKIHLTLNRLQKKIDENHPPGA